MIPVSILTGFLGAGKTTLLNRLLAHMPNERIAIVENEFGAVGIDGDLIAPSATTVVELANGCICCSVRGELTEALVDLLERRDRNEIAFDRLIIETTGLADPAPVVQTFFWDERLCERFQLDAVITLVDTCHAAEQLDHEKVAAAQVAFADWLILTKTDLADPGSLPERLRAINARARILDVQQPDTNWTQVLTTGGFSLNEKGLPAKGWKTTRNTSQSPFGNTSKRSWDDAISSIVLECEGSVDMDAISSFMDLLIEEHAADLLRYKGILSIANEPRRLIFQGVHKIAGFDYGREWHTDEARENRIVLIGRQLPEERLRQAFAAALA